MSVTIQKPGKDFDFSSNYKIYMKKCTKCQLETNNFGPNKKTRDGLKSICRICNNNFNKKYRRTKVGLISHIYSKQRSRSRNRGHEMPDYSNAELMEWMLNKDVFHELFLSWEQGGYNLGKVPSCDRLDDNQGYRLDNMRVVTWEENDRKGHESRKKN